MGGGASVHKRRDNGSDTSNDAGGGSSSQKPVKTTGFRIRRKKQKESSLPSALRRSQQGSMGKLEKGEYFFQVHCFHSTLYYGVLWRRALHYVFSIIYLPHAKTETAWFSWEEVDMPNNNGYFS